MQSTAAGEPRTKCTHAVSGTTSERKTAYFAEYRCVRGSCECLEIAPAPRDRAHLREYADLWHPSWPATVRRVSQIHILFTQLFTPRDWYIRIMQIVHQGDRSGPVG